MIINFAERAHNHNWELDPVIRSLLDTDFYKLLMLQFIWKHFPKTRVTFSLFNRHPAVRATDGVHFNLGSTEPLIPLDVDGDEQKLYRKLLDPLFSPKAVENAAVSHSA